MSMITRALISGSMAMALHGPWVVSMVYFLSPCVGRLLRVRSYVFSVREYCHCAPFGPKLRLSCVMVMMELDATLWR